MPALSAEYTQDTMETTDLPEECCVCSRQLAGSRWVKGSNQLRHSGRAVAEALRELLGCEAQLSWVCFRCYRLVLGLDYHTHQLQKQRLTLLRLYDSRSKTEQQASEVLEEKNSHAVIDSESSSIDTNSICLAAKETMGNLNIRKEPSVRSGHVENAERKLDEFSYDTTCKADNKVPYPLQCVYDHEYHRNIDQDSLPSKPATGLQDSGLSRTEILLDQHCTEKLASGTLIPSIKDSISKDKEKLGSDNTMHTNNQCFSGDILKQDLEKYCDKQKEIAAALAVPMSQRLAAKRRKTAKKWDDFEYYEDESKTTELECDKIDNLTQAHKFQLPPRADTKRCQKCKEEFATKKALLNHGCYQMKRKEREKVSYTCKGCLHIFLLRREYIKHVNSCYKNTPVTCNLCLVKLPSAAYLPRHLAALHQVKAHLNKSDILCELCGRGFSRKEALERHEARVHGKAHGSHQCSLCGHTFPHTSLLAEHLRAHQGYTCPECSKVFSCRSNLTLHRRAHHMRKAAYHCTACNRHWKFHASYIYHMKKFHRSIEHKCPDCRLLLCSEEALHQHSITCAARDSSTNQSIGQNLEACSGRSQNTEEAIKQTPNPTAVMNRGLSTSDSLCGPTQPTKTDSLVLVPEGRKTEMHEPENTSHQGPPTCEIVVEVLEETDADCQYIILVEDATDACHLSSDESAMWTTQRQ